MNLLEKKSLFHLYKYLVVMLLYVVGCQQALVNFSSFSSQFLHYLMFFDSEVHQKWLATLKIHPKWQKYEGGKWKKILPTVWLTDISYNLETNYCRVFCNYSKTKRCLLPSMRLLDMWMQHLSFSQKIYFGVVSQTFKLDKFGRLLY